MAEVDPWLAGPVPGVAEVYQPAAHALLQTRHDALRALAGVTREDLHRSLGRSASMAFHASHLVGALDRLLTYAEGGTLSAEQRRAMAAEREPDSNWTPDEVADRLSRAVDCALDRLRALPATEAHRHRAVGRAGLPTTVLGAVFHAGEHSARHAGQLVTLAQALRI